MHKRIFMILMSVVLASTNTGFAVYANEVGTVDISENETNEVNNGDLVDEDEIIIAEESSDHYGQTGMLDDETENIIIDEGKCGDNLKYALKKSDDPLYECVLTISGTGEMDDYFTNTRPYNGKICAPWNDYNRWKNNIFKKDRNFSKEPVITKLVIEDGVESIGSYAFAGVNGIAVIGQVVIPDSVKKIENHAFYGAYLIDDVYLSENLEEISPHAFEACRALKQVYFPNSVKYIRDWAFYQDEALEEVRLPENLEVIDAYAFDGCKKLKEIYFPKNVYWLGAEAFYGCEALDVIKGGEGITRLGGFFTIYDNNKNDQHYYPDNMPENHPEYYTAYPVFRSNRSYTINESAKIIDDYLDDVRDVYYERDPENRPSDDKTESYDGTNYCLEGKRELSEHINNENYNKIRTD